MTAITAEDSRALLEQWTSPQGKHPGFRDIERHLRAALDREAEALAHAAKNWDGWCAEVIERKHIEAERDAARVEVERLREALHDVMGHVDTPISRRRLGIGVHREQPEWLVDARAALAQEPRT